MKWMKKIFLGLALAITLTGCSSLIPKRVELGQDKVEKMPVAKSSEREIQRQVAQRLTQKADETYRAAIAAEAPDPVVVPAAESAVLAKANSTSLGPPLKPANPYLPSAELAAKLDNAVASLNRRVEEFREDNDKNAGHKIEGTGFLQVPYFVWLGGAAVFFLIIFIVISVGWTLLKLYGMSNPPVALGLKAVQTGGALASKAVAQLISGGKKFEERLATKVKGLSEEAKTEIVELFRSAHKEESDKDVRSVVDHLTE